MRVNTVEREEVIKKVVRIEYVAEDGQVFRSEEECKKYEESALFAVSKQLKKLNTKYLSIYDLNEDGSEECEVEIFDIQTDRDLENLKRYLYIKLSKKHRDAKYVESLFINFDGITIGHEVIIWWNYDGDCFWKYGDGSIEGYLNYLRDRIKRLITPENKEEK